MIRVTSEVGRLRRVLVHEPGPEVDHMVPAIMEELLFDDILYGDRAREEHARFRRVLQLLGIEIVEAEDLLAETLADPAARRFALDSLDLGASHGLRGDLDALPADRLAATLVGGLRREPSGSRVLPHELFAVPPLPNWCFQRDPQVLLGRGVVFASMATPARWRESVLARAIFRFHPSCESTPVIHDPSLPRGDRRGPAVPHLEGGDVLVLSEDVVAVGHSERTNRLGIEALRDALSAVADGPRWLLIVEMPKRRAYMHLDTLMTPIDRDACLVYPPVIVDEGPERAHVFEVDLRSGSAVPAVRGDLLSALRRRGIDYEPIPCGGADLLAQQREQWTDGANAFALAPGTIALYDRNRGTLDELSRRGFRVVDAEDLLLGRAEVDLDSGARACISISSHELSRARGGPHCLTHPMERDEVA